MARNIEIKARIDDFSAMYEKIGLMAEGLPDLIDQDDTFFICPHGRLKLRTLAADRGELIFYQRPDQAGPKPSFYVLTETADPDGLRNTLTLAYGAAGRVIKQRTLFMVGQTRLHLDRVKGLGDYLEFEVVLADNETPEQGIAIAEDLLEKLHIDRQELIDQAYVDLLNAKGKHTRAD
ncbi:class IV adenylate cyclase [Ewingella americana]|uniref:CYTH domain-containing protein n=1 Tax=Ewingella americana TaxID=41202 RepID=A0A502GRI4_9GAMM|nr:class IV adenylate cyclase [Ewingella americana]TPG64315.1 CYTH domain-containing protein [Ewingella americana]